MCGITGLCHVDPARPARLDLVRRMTATLVHRGPDGAGHHADGPVALGMRRLAILDVDHGDQPQFNADRSLAVIHNGEIYNYVELRDELERRGYRFRTTSDTEVLVHGYDAWGDDVVERLNGMWGFAIWDARRRRLLLSRDRLGIKPLFYHWDGATLTFGSEIKSLLEAGVPARPRWEVLDAYVAFGFVPDPYTMYAGIHKLPPAHHLVLECGPGASPQLRRYWEIPLRDAADARRDEGRIVEEFAALLDDAVRLQLRSDVPLGAFLSGGLDSSSLVALAAPRHPEGLRTFTIGFDEPDFDERPLARQVAQRYHTRHHERQVVPADLERGLDVVHRHFDEPFGDSSALAAWAVSGVAREQVTVVLTGDGGDEVQAGYTRYQGEKFSRTWQRLPAGLRRHAVRAPLQALHRLAGGSLKLRLERAVRVLETADMDFTHRLTRKQAWSAAAHRERLLAPLAGQVRPAREFIEEALQGCPARDPFQRLNWFDLRMMLPGDMLTKVDRMSMAHSLEARVPFLDHRLVELMVQVHPDVRMPGYERKHVLRRALGERLPAPLLSARKSGFNVPVREWFRGAAPEGLLQRYLGGGSLDGWIDTHELEAMLHEHRSGRRDHGVHIWILLQLAVWCERSRARGREAPVS